MKRPYIGQVELIGSDALTVKFLTEGYQFKTVKLPRDACGGLPLSDPHAEIYVHAELDPENWTLVGDVKDFGLIGRIAKKTRQGLVGGKSGKPHIVLDPAVKLYEAEPGDELIRPGADAADKASPLTPGFFGFTLDVSQLRAGDLILVEGVDLKPAEDFSIDMIKFAQLFSRPSEAYGWEDARWHHAVLYLGDLIVCEADFASRRIRLETIHKYVGRHVLRVRRPKQNLTDEQAQRFREFAVASVGTQYDSRSLARLGVAAVRQLCTELVAAVRKRPAPSAPGFADSVQISVEPKVHPRDNFLCSTLYAAAYAYATGRSIEPSPGELRVTPATLSGDSEHLEDVRLGWVVAQDAEPDDSPT